MNNKEAVLKKTVELVLPLETLVNGDRDINTLLENARKGIDHLTPKEIKKLAELIDKQYAEAIKQKDLIRLLLLSLYKAVIHIDGENKLE